MGQFDYLKRPRPTPAPRVEEPPALADGPRVLDEPKATAEPSKKAKEPKAPKATIAYKCGHTGGVRLVRGDDCPDCRAQQRKAKKEQKRAEREARPPRDKYADAGRLPDGSEFHVAYSATDHRWRGRLIVTVGGVCRDFSGEASGVFKLLTGLDAEYRAWATTQTTDA